MPPTAFLQVRRQSVLEFYLIRTCSRSTSKAIARASLPTPDQCALFALRTRGLAFNFSPLGLMHSRHTCVVCGCPEFETLASLKKDLRYDYYSLYGNPLRKYRTFTAWNLVTAELVIFLNDQLDAQFFTVYMFIPILYMFRATKCSSSGESIVSIRPLAFVTLCR